MIPMVGLTGGVGCGKSTVAAIFSELGIPTLDMDETSRLLTRPGSPLLHELTRAFGMEILDAQSGLNRAYLALHCFSDKERTQRLNQIMHPSLWDEVEQWRAKQCANYVVIEAAVLVESKATERMDAVFVVSADMVLRERRVCQRHGMTAELFQTMVARQCDDHTRMQMADFSIQNNTDMDTLRTQVVCVHHALMSRFSSAGYGCV